MKKLLVLLLAMTLVLSSLGTVVLAATEEPIVVQESTPLYNSFDFQSEADLWTNGTKTIVTDPKADGTVMKVTGLAKGTRLTTPYVDYKRGTLYTVTGKMKASTATTFEICLNMDIFIKQSTNGGTPFNYQYPNARINVGTDWTDFKFTVEIFDFVKGKDDSTPTGVASASRRIFLAPNADVPSDFVLYIDDFKIEEATKLYSGDKTRIDVYEEDFEEGYGDFLSAPANTSPMKINRETANGNSYVSFKLDPYFAEEIATYARNSGPVSGLPAGTPGGWKGGRWALEFYTGRFETRYNITLFNGKNYNIEWLMAKEDAVTGERTNNGSTHINGSIFCTNGKTIFTSSTADGASEVYPATNATGVLGKPGFFKYTNTAISSYQFGTKNADGTISGTATTSTWQLRTKYVQDVAQKMANDKLYCGSGTGAYDANGNLQSATAHPWGTYYRFTLDRSDFYGDETLGKNGAPLFTADMTEEEKNAVMDSYIYEDPNAETPVKKQYCLAYDCSFLYSPTRIQKVKEYLENYPFYLVMDDFKVTADATVYQDTVSVTGEGTITALTNPVTEEITTLTESGHVVANDYFGVTYTIIPAKDYEVESVIYDGTSYTLDSNNQFVVAPESVTEDKELKVVFKSTAPVAPSIQKTATIKTDETYDNQPSAVVYTQVAAGSDGFSIEKMGSILSDGTNEMELIAKSAQDQILTVPGFFGIRVFGAGFRGGTYFFKPFVTYSNGTDSTTVYSDQSEFTLGTAAE